MTNPISTISSSLLVSNLKSSTRMIEVMLDDEDVRDSLSEAVSEICIALRKGGKIITGGNGGSMCDAMHFAEELTGRFRNDRVALAGVPMSDAATITCIANDYGFEHVFSRYLEGIATVNDVVVLYTTSGNSANIINAIKKCRELEIPCVVITSYKCRLQDEAIYIKVPFSEYADRIQEMHLIVTHTIIQSIETIVLGV